MAEGEGGGAEPQGNGPSAGSLRALPQAYPGRLGPDSGLGCEVKAILE